MFEKNSKEDKQMKKLLSALLIVMMCLALFACGTNEPADAGHEDPVEPKGTLLMATTTSTDNTGLLDYLAPIFAEDTGWTLEWSSVGTGEALAMGQNGDVDIVLVHSKSSEEEFVANGYGVERVPVMYNDFVIVGPEAEDAYGDDVEACLRAVADGQLPFVSRGDDSGTDKKEKKLWPA